MKETQNRIKEFNDLRDWSHPKCIKDLLLNINEEIGEFWNIIKWVDTETQQRLISEEKEEVRNFIGDMIYLILKVAYICGIDSDEAIKEVMEEYEKRFPADKLKGNHANLRAGGADIR